MMSDIQMRFYAIYRDLLYIGVFDIFAKHREVTDKDSKEAMRTGSGSKNLPIYA